MRKSVLVYIVALAGFVAILTGYLFLAPPVRGSFVLGGAVVMLLAFVIAMRRGNTA
jgi:hypothetical protein